jgi:hypothetical protein
MRIGSYGAFYGASFGALRSAEEAFAPKAAYGRILWRTHPTSKAGCGADYGAYGARIKSPPGARP